MTRSRLDGTGKQKCSKTGCNRQSIAGFVKGSGLCPYHYALHTWGKKWAKHCYPDYASKGDN